MHDPTHRKMSRTTGPVTHSADLVIVGGGIVGLATALAAAERQMRVLVVEARTHGAASRAAAGMLAPSVEGLAPDARAIALEARDFYPEFLARLRERTRIDVPLDTNGILELATSSSDMSERVARADATAQPLDASALARREPAFAGHFGALFHPGDGAVDNVALMNALEAAVAAEPLIDRASDRVVSLDLSRPRPVTQTHSGQRVESDCVLLAAGAWAANIAGLPRELPVRPVHGELLTLRSREVRFVTYGGGGYLVPRGDTLLIGATSAESGFECSPTPAGREALISIARALVPSLANASVAEHWAGLRPMSPDALPILGRDPQHPALVYACGFSRNGILLAPWSASRLVRVISGDLSADALAVFSPDRFHDKLVTVKHILAG